jgi:hypothetical protein
VLGYRAIHPEYSPAEIARSRPNPRQRDRAPYGHLFDARKRGRDHVSAQRLLA